MISPHAPALTDEEQPVHRGFALGVKLHNKHENMSGFVLLCAEPWKMSLLVGAHPMGAKLTSVHTKTFSCSAETPTQKAPSEGRVREHIEPFFFHYKNTPHPALQYVWVGGQVWFHLLCNTAYYHSTEHKQWSLYLHN